ncbi:hypothetical protein [uncultured Pseudacidovorax sp.]|uniref:hypothetical protein n=1 Tax=uncultured Pseudacidovorax sp. TaxID=679313 RepID=UPI0025ED34E5|nr:hypothetical protein [uncultured Pseudacidovorax sp.]
MSNDKLQTLASTSLAANVLLNELFITLLQRRVMRPSDALVTVQEARKKLENHSSGVGIQASLWLEDLEEGIQALQAEHPDLDATE